MIVSESSIIPRSESSEHVGYSEAETGLTEEEIETVRTCIRTLKKPSGISRNNSETSKWNAEQQILSFGSRVLPFLETQVEKGNKLTANLRFTREDFTNYFLELATPESFELGMALLDSPEYDYMKDQNFISGQRILHGLCLVAGQIRLHNPGDPRLYRLFKKAKELADLLNSDDLRSYTCTLLAVCTGVPEAEEYLTRVYRYSNYFKDPSTITNSRYIKHVGGFETFEDLQDRLYRESKSGRKVARREAKQMSKLERLLGTHSTHTRDLHENYTSDEGLEIEFYEVKIPISYTQNGTRIRFPRGTVIGKMDFMPFNDAYLKPEHLTSNLARGVRAMSDYLSNAGPNELYPKPDFLVGATNPKMAAASTRLGFEVIGYQGAKAVDGKNIRPGGLKEQDIGDERSVVVVGVPDVVRHNIERLSSIYKRLEARERRQDTQ